MEENGTPPELNDYPVGHIVAGRYEVLEHLGYGGMGFVVKTKDLVLDGETAVLKILYPRFAKDPVVFARFRREVLLTRKLSHSNIVKIYDFGDAGNGTCFFSMECVDGENLATKVQKLSPSGVPVRDAAYYLYHVALGLSYAHSHGIIHRDIKPANILIAPDGDVKITDFGVARSVESKEQLTRTNEAIGSPLYMSPEQLNAGKIDHRSDVYSLGIMAYELATGKPPFSSEHWFMLVKMVLSDPIPQFASRESGIPLWYQEMVMKATAKDPDARFQSAADFARFISKHFDLRMKDSNRQVAEEQVNGNKWNFMPHFMAPVAAVLLLSLIGMGGYFLFSRLPEFLNKF